MMAMTPAVMINTVLDNAKLPHIRHLSCRKMEQARMQRCYGTVNGRKTTWYVNTRGGTVQLVCICYLRKTPKPVARSS